MPSSPCVTDFPFFKVEWDRMEQNISFASFFALFYFYPHAPTVIDRTPHTVKVTNVRNGWRVLELQHVSVYYSGQDVDTKLSRVNFICFLCCCFFALKLLLNSLLCVWRFTGYRGSTVITERDGFLWEERATVSFFPLRKLSFVIRKVKNEMKR